MKYKIAIHSFYFGKWPDWIHLYFETLKQNSTIDFYITTNCDTSVVEADNIHFLEIEFEEYVKQLGEKLNLKLEYSNPVKLCDLRPFIGVFYKEHFKQYDFFGWTDLDLLFGDIRSFYTDELLDKYEAFASHTMRMSGHLSILRNTSKNRNLYKHIWNWEEKLLNPNFIGNDEYGAYNVLTMTIIDKINEKFKINIDNFFTRAWKKMKIRKLYFVEQYTTPFTDIPWLDKTIQSNQPDIWYYKDGKITNARDGNRCFIYLHFMNFKSSHWRHDGTKAPWEGKSQICFAAVEDMKKGIVINSEGFYPLEKI